MIPWSDSAHRVNLPLRKILRRFVRVQTNRYSYLPESEKSENRVEFWRHSQSNELGTSDAANALLPIRRDERTTCDNEVNMTRPPIRQVLLSAAITATVCLLAVLGAGTSAFSQSTGKHDFVELCAPCHGIDGTGKGRDLTEANPPDLTDISLRNGGKFPFEKVYRMVDGRGMMDSHKRFAMPFWGIYLQKQSNQPTPVSDAAVKQRITEIVRYVETMQKK